MTHATPDGTRDLAQRHTTADFYRQAWGLRLASVGLGTYLGGHDDETDRRYVEAIGRYLQLGGNLIDTASNYRFQRSERAIGRALADAFAAGVAREGIVVASKAGFIPYDGAPPDNPKRWLREHVIGQGLATEAEVVGYQHCLAPAFLQAMIDQSLRNTGLQQLDLYYLHNPEAQLEGVERDAFRERMRHAFEALEAACDAGKIARYGIATWGGLRLRPQLPGWLELADLVALAREVAGEAHRFAAVQLPLNLAMVEGLREPTQPVNGRLLPAIAAANELGLTVITSAALLQARLSQQLPPFVRDFFGLERDAQRALQFARSAPGVSAALVGMSSAHHVETNLALRDLPPAPETVYERLFTAP